MEIQNPLQVRNNHTDSKTCCHQTYDKAKQTKTEITHSNKMLNKLIT